MIEKFLHAKHWQLFLLTFGIPFAFQIVFMFAMVRAVTDDPTGNPMLNYLWVFPVVVIIFLATFLGWFWSVANGLHLHISPELRLKITRFRIFFGFAVLYMFFFSGFMITTMSMGGPNPGIFAVIIPLHLLAMFCLFYCLYFVAKTKRTAELQRKVSAGDYVGEFFLIWFFPVGIWFIQPRINKIAAEYTSYTAVD